MIEVTVPQDEYDEAIRIGKKRFEQAKQGHMRDTIGEDDERSHVLGAIGECAAAKALGIEWSKSLHTFKTVPDVGRFDIRTRSRSDGELIVRENDPVGRPVILVVPSGGRSGRDWCLAGQIDGSLYWRQVRWWGDPGGRGHPCWSIPQEFLIPVHS